MYCPVTLATLVLTHNCCLKSYSAFSFISVLVLDAFVELVCSWMIFSLLLRISCLKLDCILAVLVDLECVLKKGYRVQQHQWATLKDVQLWVSHVLLQCFIVEDVFLVLSLICVILVEVILEEAYQECPYHYLKAVVFLVHWVYRALSLIYWS